MKGIRPLVLALLFLSTVSTDLAAQRALSSTQKRKVDAALKAVKDGTDSDKLLAVRKIAPFGDPLHKYLLGLAQKHPERGEVFEAMRKLDWVEGKDLIAKDVKAPQPEWSLWTIGAGEVIVLRGVNQWAGLRIHDDYDPSKGLLTVTVALTKDKLLPLGGPGVKRETKNVAGKEVVLEGASPAFPVRDYSMKVFGSDVLIRSVGSGAFRYGLRPGAPAVARTGRNDLRRVKASDKKLVFQDRPPTEIVQNCRRTQQYLFRIIDGMEPLPTYGTEDESRFASAEQVQVQMREEGTGKRVLLVAFPHSDESVPYDDGAHALLTSFARRLFDVGPKDVLVWIGKNEAHETNWFFEKGKWKRPRGRLQKRVRALFPEDY
ncbi:MAG: hypothetical protein CMJ83_10235 [Planctomycetes bacterium]|nr:hypothetical protein [Planctomycetota bacterium]